MTKKGRWDYASLHDIDNRESHDEQELKELEEIKRVINVLKSVAGERASQYELFAVRVVRTRLECE